MTRHELNEVFLRTSFLQGANATYLAELYARYEQDPASLDPEWRAFFASLDDDKEDVLAEARGPSWTPSNGRGARCRLSPQGALSRAAGAGRGARHAGARMLIRAYRTRGHLAAKLDPLELVTRREHPELKPKTYGFTKADYDRPIYIGGAFGLEFGTLRQMLDILRHTYCRPYRRRIHAYLRPRSSAPGSRIASKAGKISFTPEGKKAILKKLIEAESFERFLDVKYTGTKRFGLDGGELIVPALEQIIKRGGQLGVGEIVIGMPHRGRLNVLANVMAKPYRAIFNEFKGGSAHPDEVEGSGDVKYHLGASSDREFDRQSRASVADRQPLASGDRRSGGARQGAGQAGPARRLASARKFCRCCCMATRPSPARAWSPNASACRACAAIAPAARCISSSTIRSASPPRRASPAPRPIPPTSPR